MAAKQAMKENLQCTSKYGHLRISQDICHVRMTDIEGFLTICGHSDNLLNNKYIYIYIYIYTIITIIKRWRLHGQLLKFHAQGDHQTVPLMAVERKFKLHSWRAV